MRITAKLRNPKLENKKHLEAYNKAMRAVEKLQWTADYHQIKDGTPSDSDSFHNRVQVLREPLPRDLVFGTTEIHTGTLEFESKPRKCSCEPEEVALKKLDLKASLQGPSRNEGTYQYFSEDDQEHFIVSTSTRPEKLMRDTIIVNKKQGTITFDENYEPGFLTWG